MRKKFKLWGLLVLAVIAGLWSGTQIQAAKQPPANFEMTPLLPDNQIDKKASYFNLQVKPGATQVLKVAVSNPTADAKTLRVVPVNATTSDTGNVVYIPSSRQDPSATTTFTKMTSAAVTIKLAPHQAKTVSFTTRIPKAGFPGEVLGGIFVTDTQSQGAKLKSKQGFAIKNRYAEVAAVALWSQPKKSIPVKLLLADARVKTVNQQLQVAAKIRNVTPTLFGQLQIKARVIQQSSGKTVATQTLKSGSMAPNSWFNYAIVLGSATRLPAGKYVVKLQLTSGKRKWNLQRDFTLSAQRAQQHNHQINKRTARQWWPWVLAGIVGLGLLAGAYWFGRCRSR